MPANRERLNTGGSYASQQRASATGGLRERTNTVDSVRSMGSAEGSSSFPSTELQLLMGNASPPPPTGGKKTITTKRLSNPSVLFPTATTTMQQSPRRPSWKTLPVGAGSTTATTSSGSTMTRRRKVIDWIQRQPMPRRLLPSRKTASSSSSTPQVYWISGLDRVLLGGTVAAADAVLIGGMKPPRYLWYMLSGACCDVIQLLLDMILYLSFHIQDASVCWAAGFFGSIVFRHTFHRYLVFGDYVGGYWASLGRMYAGYSVILVLSTIFNILMTKVAETSHYVAWILTLLWTGIANYFILKKLWSFGGSSAGGAAVASTTTGSSNAAAVGGNK